MRLNADYHTHTVHSHGTGSIPDNVEAALAAGLSTVGITDHSIAHVLYGVKYKQLGYYCNCIGQAKEKYAGRIEIKSGIELNLTGLEGSFDLPDDAEFDTVILGYHKAARCEDLKTAWTFFRQREKEITRAYMLAIQKGHINIVSHPGYGVPVDFRRLARACADYGTLLEINEKHGMSMENLQEAALEPVRFVISSDAHRPTDVGQAPIALALVKAAGFGPGRVVNITEE